jgi:hypothetical protein
VIAVEVTKTIFFRREREVFVAELNEYDIRQQGSGVWRREWSVFLFGVGD